MGMHIETGAVGSGKSHSLIKKCVAYNGTIVVPSGSQVRFYKDYAKELYPDREIKIPITLSRYMLLWNLGKTETDPYFFDLDPIFDGLEEGSTISLTSDFVTLLSQKNNDFIRNTYTVGVNY